MRKDMSYVHFGFDSGPLGGALVSLPGSSTWGSGAELALREVALRGKDPPVSYSLSVFLLSVHLFPFQGSVLPRIGDSLQ